MKLLKYSLLLVALLSSLLFGSCTHKELVTEEDDFQYYKLTKKDRIGVKDLEGNIIVPIKMKSIKYQSRYIDSKNNKKDKWFRCECYDNDYIEIYNLQNNNCIISEDLKFKKVRDFYKDAKRTNNYTPSSTFFIVSLKDKSDKTCRGVYDIMGQEIIPIKYKSINFVRNRSVNIHFGDSEKLEKYAYPSDLIECSDFDGYISVFDVHGKCIISESEKYIGVNKVAIPTSTPLLCLFKKKGECEYRYFHSGKLFLSGYINTIHVIDWKNELYYLEVSNDKERYGNIGIMRQNYNDISYYDLYGNLIFSGKELRYDKRKGFYWIDENYDEQYINRIISKDGYVAPVYSYSNSSWDRDYYDNQGVWMESDMDGKYGRRDYSSSTEFEDNGDSKYQRKTHQCGLCGGTGKVIKTDGTSFGNTKYCDECGKIVPDSHYHTICPSCKGKGYW